jgi:hypothetical protein
MNTRSNAVDTERGTAHSAMRLGSAALTEGIGPWLIA